MVISHLKQVRNGFFSPVSPNTLEMRNFLSYFRTRKGPYFMPELRKVIYFTDGAAQHFKNKRNFQNLLHHYDDFAVDAEWHLGAFRCFREKQCLTRKFTESIRQFYIDAPRFIQMGNWVFQKYWVLFFIKRRLLKGYRKSTKQASLS